MCSSVIVSSIGFQGWAGALSGWRYVLAPQRPAEPQKCRRRPISHAPVSVLEQRNQTEAPRPLIARCRDLCSGGTHRPVRIIEGMLDLTAHFGRPIGTA